MPSAVVEGEQHGCLLGNVKIDRQKIFWTHFLRPPFSLPSLRMRASQGHGDTKVVLASGEKLHEVGLQLGRLRVPLLRHKLRWTSALNEWFWESSLYGSRGRRSECSFGTLQHVHSKRVHAQH